MSRDYQGPNPVPRTPLKAYLIIGVLIVLSVYSSVELGRLERKCLAFQYYLDQQDCLDGVRDGKISTLKLEDIPADAWIFKGPYVSQSLNKLLAPIPKPRRLPDDSPDPPLQPATGDSSPQSFHWKRNPVHQEGVDEAPQDHGQTFLPAFRTPVPDATDRTGKATAETDL